MKPITVNRKQLVVAAVVAVAILLVWLLIIGTDNSMELDHNKEIDITPAHIRSIRDIGEWEFLSVSDEEFVDTMRRGFLRNDHLARIYYGTMRIGVDLSDVEEDWLVVEGDTVILTLPPVGLLDERFIDEARTVAFHESGKWKATDREDLYQRARRRMMVYGLSKENLKSAEDNADAQFRQLLRSMGFENVVIRFRRSSE